MGQTEPTENERRHHYGNFSQIVAGGLAFAAGLMVVLLTKDKLSDPERKALWWLAAAVPGWVLLWSSLKDMDLHWHCKTPRLLIQNFILGTVPAMIGTSTALFALMERVSVWVGILFGSLGIVVIWRMWKAMDLTVAESHISGVTPREKQ